jgi:hypothetical protein
VVPAPAVKACQKADESFPSITPHDLRHTAASLAVSAGANVKAVQRMLGHAEASMTLDVYTDLFPATWTTWRITWMRRSDLLRTHRVPAMTRASPANHDGRACLVQSR